LAYVKPVKPKVPESDDDSWTINNPIDNFILDKLKQKKFSPSKEAGRELLLRRVSLDLTGLPPTLAEIDNFLNDNVFCFKYISISSNLLILMRYGSFLILFLQVCSKCPEMRAIDMSFPRRNVGLTCF
jgi:hypothetical protein